MTEDNGSQDIETGIEGCTLFKYTATKNESWTYDEKFCDLDLILKVFRNIEVNMNNF